MKFILDNIYYVSKDGKKHFFKQFKCEIPEGITDEEEISNEIAKCMEQYAENEESK